MISESRPMGRTTESPLGTHAVIQDFQDTVAPTPSPTAGRWVSRPTPPDVSGADGVPRSSTAAPAAMVHRTDHYTSGDPHLQLHYSVLSPADPFANATFRPVLVLVHGLEHRGDCWLPTATLLVERHSYTVILVTLRGHGESHWSFPVSRATFSQYILDVECVLDDYQRLVACANQQAAHQIDQIDQINQAEKGNKPLTMAYILVGHSMGGPVVELVARRRAVAGLYLLATVTPSRFLAAVWRSLAGLFWRHLLFHPKHLLGVLTGRRCMFDTSLVIRRYLLGTGATEEQVHALLHQLGPESLQAIRGILFQGIRDRWHLRFRRGYLRSVSRAQHIRVVAAGEDALMSPVAAAETARLLGADDHFLRGLPHDAMCAQPNDDSLEGEALAEELALFADGIRRAAAAGI